MLAAACFVIGLHLMNSPATGRRGNQVSMTGMVIAGVATLVLMIHYGTVTTTGWIVLITGALIGSGVGLYAARTIQMTAIPQLVSMFNSVGGGAAALVAIYGYYYAESHAGPPSSLLFSFSFFCHLFLSLVSLCLLLSSLVSAFCLPAGVRLLAIAQPILTQLRDVTGEPHARSHADTRICVPRPSGLAGSAPSRSAPRCR